MFLHVCHMKNTCPFKNEQVLIHTDGDYKLTVFILFTYELPLLISTFHIDYWHYEVQHELIHHILILHMVVWFDMC